MKQGRMLACAALAALALAAPVAAQAAARTSAKAAAKSSTKAAALRQFTGTVTALDKASVTVEKQGKKPRRMTFARAAEMRTTGELEKDARVTVWYREEGGRTVAHRVVVKTPGGAPPAAQAPQGEGSD